MSASDNDIGNLIKQKRIEKGFTLEQVGNKVGVGKSTVSKWERGAIKNMKKDKVNLLSSMLGIDPLIFVYGVDFKEKENFYKKINTDNSQELTREEFAKEVKRLLSQTTNLTEQEKALLLHPLEYICSDKE